MRARMWVLGCVLWSVLPARQPITWWYEGATPAQQQDLLTGLCDVFNARNKDYRLSIEFRSGLSGLQKDVSVALASRGGPDIVQTAGPTYLVKLVKAGHLEPLDAYAKKYGWADRLIDPLFRTGMVGDKLYSVPKTMESLGVFYNKEVFADNGWDVPRDRAGWRRLLVAAKAKGLIPVVIGNQGWQPSNEQYYTMFLNAVAGPEHLYRVLVGEEPWDSPAIKRSFEELQQLFDEGFADIRQYFSINGAAAIRSVLRGESAVTFAGTWAFQWVDKRDEEKIGFAAMPTLAEGLPYPIFPIGVGATLSINRYSKVKDGAAAVLDFALSDRFYQEINAVWPGEWAIPLKDPPRQDSPTPYLKAIGLLSEALNHSGFGYTSWTFFPPSANQELIKGVERVWLGKQELGTLLRRVGKIADRERRSGDTPPVIAP